MLYYLAQFIFVGVIPFGIYLYLARMGSDSGRYSRAKQYSGGVRLQDMDKLAMECMGKSPAERRRIINRYCR